MFDISWEAIASNLIVAGLLALLAQGVHLTRRYPSLAHRLWIVVLLKLVTPPLFAVPLVTLPFAVLQSTALRPSTLPLAASSQDAVDGTIAASSPLPLTAGPESTSGSRMAIAESLDASQVSIVLLALWVVGSASFLILSIARSRRFTKRLRTTMVPVPQDLRHFARGVARDVGLARLPELVVTRACVAPFVWSAFGKVRLVLPSGLVDAANDSEIGQDQLRSILCHELTHAKRRDPWVRWLEWVVSIVHWWNPLAWWVRRSLRIDEELACDAQVLRHESIDRYTYANSLLDVAEFLATTGNRRPTLASAIDGGCLEARIRMITSKPLTKTPRWLTIGAALLALAALPMSFVRAQDFQAVERRLGAAVEAGEITLDQARVMLDALRKSAHAPHRDARAAGKADAHAGETNAVKVDAKTKYVAFEKKVAEAVRRGDLSKEDAKAKLFRMREELFGKRRSPKEEYNRIEMKIKAAVKEGHLSPEDAKRKLAHEHERLFGKTTGSTDRVEKKATKPPAVPENMPEKMKERTASLADLEEVYGIIELDLLKAVQDRRDRESADRQLSEFRQWFFGDKSAR